MSRDGGAGKGRRPGAPPPALKRLGQHFLADRSVLARIADALRLTGEETVVEIGPGRGALTDLLAARAKRLVAVEVDRGLIPVLREKYADRPHVEIVEADVLDVPLHELAGGPFRLAGNVPYYITTPILFHALQHPRAEMAVYLVQKEVAERVAAAPGSGNYGALSVNVQALAVPELLFKVGPGAFRPPPKVDSAVIRVTPRPDPVIRPELERRYQRFVQECFAQRRKQLRRVLRGVASLSAEEAEAVCAEVGLAPEARPEVLSPADYARLVERLFAGG